MKYKTNRVAKTKTKTSTKQTNFQTPSAPLFFLSFNCQKKDMASYVDQSEVPASTTTIIEKKKKKTEKSAAVTDGQSAVVAIFYFDVLCP